MKLEDRSFKAKYRTDQSLRVRFRLEWFRHAAKRKGKSIALSDAEQERMVTSRCAYCHQAATDATFNGIDMLDATCTRHFQQSGLPRSWPKVDPYVGSLVQP